MPKPIVNGLAIGTRDGQSPDEERRRIVRQAFGAMILLRPVAGADGRYRDAHILEANAETARLIRATSTAVLTGESVSNIAAPAAVARLLDRLTSIAGASGETPEFDWSPRAGLPAYRARATMVGGRDVLLSLGEAIGPALDQVSLQQILDHAPFAVVVKTPDGRYLFVNREFERQVGVRAADVVGKTPLEVLPPELGERFAARDELVRSTRTPASIESEETLQGKTRIFISKAFPLLDEHGDVTAIVGTETDITALREAERRLSESEKRFRAIFETAAVGIAVYGRDRRMITCNPTYAKILGYAPEELVGVSFLDFTHEDDRVRNLELVRRQASGKIGSFEIEKRYVRKDGSTIWGRASVSLIRDEQGAPLFTIAVLADTSDRHAAEDRLRQSERQLRLITDSLPILIAYCDTRGRYRFVNRTYEQWTGRHRDQMIGASIRTTIGEANYQRIAPFIDAVLTGRPQSFETEIDYAKAGKKSISCDYVPHVLDDGRVHGFFVVVTDISLRKEQERLLRVAKDEAEEISRAKSAFLATMSHELRTPLNAIIGFSEMIRDEVVGPVGSPRYKDYASDIHESGKQLLDLINSILDLARVEAGTLEIDLRPVDIVEVARSALQIMHGPAAAAGLTMESDFPSGPVVIEGDAAKLRQIMVNLLSNSIKFTPSGGTVSLGIALAPDSTAILEIKDTGIGITEDHIARAFELFGQVDNRFSRRYQGAGIGLPLSKALVEAHRGSFAIRSAPGHGTTVTARFPLLHCGENKAIT